MSEPSKDQATNLDEELVEIRRKISRLEENPRSNQRALDACRAHLDQLEANKG